MVNFNGTSNTLGDKEMLQDSLLSQKLMTANYNTWAGECVNEQLKGAMMNILDDEHRIQADIFCNMQSNGWYQTEPADQNKIQQARQKFSQQP